MSNKKVHEEKWIAGEYNEFSAMVQVELAREATDNIASFRKGSTVPGLFPEAHERAARAVLCVNLFRGVENPKLLKEFYVDCGKLLAQFIQVDKASRQNKMLLLAGQRTMTNAQKLAMYQALVERAREMLGDEDEGGGGGGGGGGGPELKLNRG